MRTCKVVLILVADDFEAWRVSVRDMLRPYTDWQIVGEACNGIEAIQKSAELRPDVVLLDLQMPLLNGIEASEEIRLCSPYSRIVFVTQNTDRDIRRKAFNSGAEAYVIKSNAATTLIPAIRQVLDKGFERYVPNV